MQNNPFYVLSERYKKDSAAKPAKQTCVQCKNKHALFSRGVYKGLCQTCKDTMCTFCRLEPAVEKDICGSWCKSCLEFDAFIDAWSWACWDESMKPASEQNPKVYLGQF